MNRPSYNGKLNPMPAEPTTLQMLDEAMRVIGILNAAGKHSLETIDAHCWLCHWYWPMRPSQRKDQT